MILLEYAITNPKRKYIQSNINLIAEIDKLDQVTKRLQEKQQFF